MKDCLHPGTCMCPTGARLSPVAAERGTTDWRCRVCGERVENPWLHDCPSGARVESRRNQ